MSARTSEVRRLGGQRGGTGHGGSETFEDVLSEVEGA